MPSDDPIPGFGTAACVADAVGGLGHADDPQGSKLLMVLEFVEGGPVLGGRGSSKDWKPVSEPVARAYFRDVIQVPVLVCKAGMGARVCACVCACARHLFIF